MNIAPEEMPSESELYNNIVEMLSNGNFLQLNGKAINLTELNEYINAQGREIERLNNIINELERTIYYKAKYFRDIKERSKVEICMDILNKLQELKVGDK